MAGGPRPGVDLEALGLAWSLIVYMTGKDLGIVEPMTLVDLGTGEVLDLTPGETMTLDADQPIVSDPPSEFPQAHELVSLTYRGTPLRISLADFCRLFVVSVD